MGAQLSYEGARWFVWGLIIWWSLLAVALIGGYLWFLKKEKEAAHALRGLDDAWRPGLDQPCGVVASVERGAAAEEVATKISGRNRPTRIPHGGG